MVKEFQNEWNVWKEAVCASAREPQPENRHDAKTIKAYLR
jgi:hypothetical protein